MRWVAVLFWNLEGYRQLRTVINAAKWHSWSSMSGHLWDIFFAGCEQYVPDSNALKLTDDDPPVRWNEQRSIDLALEISQMSEAAANLHPGIDKWTFSGPLEMVLVGARRDTDGEVVIDWKTTRAMKLDATDLDAAVSHYTTRHERLDDPEATRFTAPGDCDDDELAHKVWRDFLPFFRTFFKLGSP